MQASKQKMPILMEKVVSAHGVFRAGRDILGGLRAQKYRGSKTLPLVTPSQRSSQFHLDSVPDS